MPTNPKIKPCPHCGTSFLSVYTYDNKWRYVECDGIGCSYQGPGTGSARQAIKAHNADSDAHARANADINADT